MAVEEAAPERHREQAAQDALSADEAAPVDLALSELVETMERVDWADVPTISVPEAATWNARLAEARDTVREAGQDV